jgi:hypothetical protein
MFLKHQEFCKIQTKLRERYFDNTKKPVVNFTRLNSSQERVPEPPPQIANYHSSFRSDNNSTGNLYNQTENNTEPSWDN